MGATTTGDYPKNLPDFYRRFPDDAACLRYLVETRWPSGFRCPGCGSADARLMEARRAWTCRDCRRQTSATAGTTLHGSKLPLQTWFLATWLMTTLKPGISALQLQGQLGLTRHGTAWLLLHKLRAAMVNPGRGPLVGEVEMDDTWVGGKQPGLKGGQQRAGRNALKVLVAVERRSKSLGRVRMEIIASDDSPVFRSFVDRNIAPGTIIYSDANAAYGGGIDPARNTLRSLSQIAGKRATGRHTSAVPGADRVISNLKTWLAGTYHGVGADHLDAYLNEFVFRFNRRRTPAAGFAALLGLTAVSAPRTVKAITPPPAQGQAKRRPGRATGQTGTRFPNPPPPGPPSRAAGEEGEDQGRGRVRASAASASRRGRR